MHCILFSLTQYPWLSRSPGIYRIAHWLRQHGLDVEVIDWANHWSMEDLRSLLHMRVNTHTKFFGFGQLFTCWNDKTEQLGAWMKQQYPHIHIISGSAVLPTFTSKHIDYYVQGFGEHAVLALVRWLYSNGTRPKFSLQKANNKPLIKANESYPAFPEHSLNIIYQDRDYIQPHEWLGIETARGCKFECRFCNFPVLGVRKDHSRDADDFELQMRDAYDRFGVKNYIIADETFNDSTDKITKFADTVARLPFVPYFSAFIRADLMISRPEDLPELARMNVLGHYYGIESFNTQSAKAIGKGMHGERLQQGVLDARDYLQKHSGGQYRGTIAQIIGLPYETLESIDRAKLWLLENWRDQSWISYPLFIPEGPSMKLSVFSKDYEKFGYRQMSTEVRPNSIGKTRLGNEIPWCNEHMDIFQAHDIVDQHVKIRNDTGFKTTCFHIACRFKKSITTLAQRLDLSTSEFNEAVDPHIDSYVRSKLNGQ